METTLLGIARGYGITPACQIWGRLDPDTYFDHAHAMPVERVEESIAAMNRFVLEKARRLGALPPTCRVAFDLHVDPDYSKRHDGCIGYKDLPGTNWGMAYLSAESVTPNARFTFAVAPIRAATNREEALRAQVEETLRWVRIELALLDRGFQAVHVFRLFSEKNVPFVVPMIRNQRIDTLEGEAWRSRVRIPNTSYSYFVVPEYEMGNEDRRVVVQLVFFYEPDPKEPDKDVPFVFATNAGELSPARIVELASTYRKRWGIETGYRKKNELRVRTCSPHYATRLFLQLASVVAYNLWTLLRVFSAWQPGSPVPGPPPCVLLLREFREGLVETFGA
ncbi:MAG: transposase [Methanobacteriota archaeon]